MLDYHAFVVLAESGEITCGVQGAESSDEVALDPRTHVITSAKNSCGAC